MLAILILTPSRLTCITVHPELLGERLMELWLNWYLMDRHKQLPIPIWVEVGGALPILPPVLLHLKALVSKFFPEKQCILMASSLKLLPMLQPTRTEHWGLVMLGQGQQMIVRVVELQKI